MYELQIIILLMLNLVSFANELASDVLCSSYPRPNVAFCLIGLFRTFSSLCDIEKKYDGRFSIF